MARSISVKVPTSLLIAQIEERIAQIDKDIAEYPAKREQYDKDLESYKNTVANFIAAYIGKNLDKIGFEYESIIRIHDTYLGRNNNKVEFTFQAEAIVGFPKRPECPEAPNQREWFGRDHATRKELLEKNLRILKMTSQEEVNASTYGAIMEII